MWMQPFQPSLQREGVGGGERERVREREGGGEIERKGGWETGREMEGEREREIGPYWPQR